MDRKTLASHIDATMVRTGHDIVQIDQMIEAAKEYRFACCFSLPCYSVYVRDALAGTGVNCGYTIGFPSGGETTEAKCFQAREGMDLKMDEFDMVINVGWLLSGYDDKVTHEIKVLKEIVGEKPLKCIIEASLLDEDQIKRAVMCVLNGGADYVKTGTGWLGPATIDQVRLMKETAGDALLVKAAGGIRTKEEALAFIDAGADRLGIGLKSSIALMKEFA